MGLQLCLWSLWYQMTLQAVQGITEESAGISFNKSDQGRDQWAVLFGEYTHAHTYSALTVMV